MSLRIVATFRRSMFVVTLLVCLFGRNELTILGAAPTVQFDLCESICTLDVPCDTDCDVYYPDSPTFSTDCGTYNDGQCGNTCDVICTPYESGATECEDIDGEPTTCEEYGVYLHCEDDTCVSGESCTCGGCECQPQNPTNITGMDPGDPESVCSSLTAVGSSLPCPDEYLYSPSSCQQKLNALDNLRNAINALLFFQKLVQDNWPTYTILIGQINGALTSLTTEYFEIAAMSCYPDSQYRRR